MEKLYKLIFGKFSHSFESLKDAEDFKALLAKTDPKTLTRIKVWNEKLKKWERYKLVY